MGKGKMPNVVASFVDRSVEFLIGDANCSLRDLVAIRPIVAIGAGALFTDGCLLQDAAGLNAQALVLAQAASEQALKRDPLIR